MSDTSPQISMNSSWRVFFAVISLLFFSGIVVYLIIWGDPKNSLHSSALSWGFFGDMVVLGALGFGAVVELIPYVFTKK